MLYLRQLARLQLWRSPGKGIALNSAGLQQCCTQLRHAAKDELAQAVVMSCRVGLGLSNIQH